MSDDEVAEHGVHTRGAGGREKRRAPALILRLEALMPLYYFQVQSGRRHADRQGLLLNSMVEARNHAKTIDTAIRFSDNVRTRWAVVVRDEEGTVVYEIRRDH